MGLEGHRAGVEGLGSQGYMQRSQGGARGLGHSSWTKGLGATGRVNAGLGSQGWGHVGKVPQSTGATGRGHSRAEVTRLGQRGWGLKL